VSSVTETPLLDPEAEAALAEYADKAIAVEPGGVEYIPAEARHGSPIQLFWTWTSPNLEFATIAVGILAVLVFRQSFWAAALAIVVGTGLGSVTHGILSSWGPESGFCQMILSRTGFGFLGNILPAGLNSVIAGIGWFAVNSVSGALALHALWDVLPKALCLIIVVAAQLIIAFLGHNLIHVFERYAFPLLAIVFVIGAIIVLSKSHPGQSIAGAQSSLGAFLLTAGAAFGYACGWNPYASDYTRYLPANTPKLSVGLYAGLGVFVSCVFLEIAGAAMVTAAKAPDIDPGVYTSLMPTVLAKLTLLCIAVGAVAANALNIYSGAMSFMALGLRLPTHIARGIVALVFGTIGFFVALDGLNNVSRYEDFLLVIAYWIAPWLGVVLVDRWLRPNIDRTAIVGDTRYQNWAGPIAMALGMVISIWLFAAQVKYTGPIPKHHPAFGDLTFEVGFVISAVTYYVLVRVLRPMSRVTANA
jgi:purine-cytosine permease-like protein